MDELVKNLIKRRYENSRKIAMRNKIRETRLREVDEINKIRAREYARTMNRNFSRKIEADDNER